MDSIKKIPIRVGDTVRSLADRTVMKSWNNPGNKTLKAGSIGAVIGSQEPYGSLLLVKFVGLGHWIPCHPSQIELVKQAYDNR